MTTKKVRKSSIDFYCSQCNYVTSRESQYKRHLLTRKHQMTTNDNKIVPNYICDICDKVLADRVSLWKHKKTCKEVLKNELREPEKVVEGVPDISKMITPDMIMTLLTQNQEFKELIVEQHQEMTKLQNKLLEREDKLIEVAKEGKTINNNCMNNSNNKFNLNFFLNEQCKNAMNIKDFVNNMVLTVEDLKNTGDLGYIDGITKIFTDKLKEIDTYDRPMHCTDLKRETLYIKENNEWDKDGDKEKMKKAIECVANKNLNNLGNWKEENPGHEVMDSREDQEFVKIMTNSLGGMGSDREKNKQKIMKNVMKEVIVDK